MKKISKYSFVFYNSEFFYMTKHITNQDIAIFANFKIITKATTFLIR